jgi:HEAT repeat protein
MNSLEEHAEKLNCNDEAERTYAAEDIGYLNSADAVPPLLERLGKEPSRAVREAIFQALTRIDAEAAIEACVRLLESDDPQIRNQAVDVLRRKGAQSIPFLKITMRDGDKDLRKLVLDVLSEVHAGDSEAIYEAALADQDQNVVITAVENLGRMRATAFRSRIEHLLEGECHPMLAGACLEALVSIGNANSLAAIHRRFPDLATLPEFFLVPYLRAIGALGTATELMGLAELLATRNSHLRPAILDAVIALHQRYPEEAYGETLLPALRAVVENGDTPLCRYQAVRALGLFSSRDDVYTFLASCLSSSERLVRLAAAESLRIAERPGWGQLLAAHALEESDEEVLQALSC